MNAFTAGIVTQMEKTAGPQWALAKAQGLLKGGTKGGGAWKSGLSKGMEHFKRFAGQAKPAGTGLPIGGVHGIL
jgi:hypothetical protein